MTKEIGLSEIDVEGGLFMLSWDFELSWGFHDEPSTVPDYLAENGDREYIDAIIDILEKYGIESTWGTVGHLFLEECGDGQNDDPHPDLPKPDRDWYDSDPGSSVKENPAWYAPDVVGRLVDSEVYQEIACHTFSHVPVSSSREVIEEELRKCREVVPDGIDLKSFIAPRHGEIPYTSLKNNGFRCYRAHPPRTGYTDIFKFYSGYGHPPTSLPKLKYGVYEIPVSTYFFYNPLHPVEARIPDLKLRWFRRGINAAIKTNSLFHVYAHPHNFIQDKNGLEQLRLLSRMVNLKQNEEGLTVTTMGELADRLKESRPPGEVH